MAGEKHILNMEEYPPLPPSNQNNITNLCIPSLQSHDRNKISPPPSQVHLSAINTSGNQDSLNLVIGSILVPSIPNPSEQQISIPHKNNPVDSIITKPPPSLIAKVIAPVSTPNSLDKSNHGIGSKGIEHVDSHIEKIEDAQIIHRVPTSNLAKAYSGSFDFQPCHKILGKPCVSFSMDYKNRLLSSMNYILVVKFSHFRPKFKDFNEFLMNMKFLGKFRIFQFDMKHVFVEFLVFEDFIKIWMLKSRFIGGYRGRFFRWDCDFMPNIESYVAPIWVHLPHFPLYLFDEKAIISVANVFGKPIFIDSASIRREKVGMLSFCIAKDVRVKGPSEILVEFVGNGIIVDRFSQLVNYGVIPDYCSKCFHLGHCYVDCKVIDSIDKGVETVSNRSNMMDNEALSHTVPVVSVFDRLHVTMAKNKDSLGVDKELVLIEDLSEDEHVEGGLGSREELFTVQGKVAGISDDVLRTTDLSKTNPVSFATQTLEPDFKNSGTVLLSSSAGDISLTSNEYVNTDQVFETAGVGPQIVAATSVDAAPTAGLQALITTAQPLVPSNLFSGAPMQGSLVGDPCVQSILAEKMERSLETDGEELVLTAARSPEDAAGLVQTDSDSSVAASLKSHISTPGAVVQRYMAGDDSMISKVGIGTDKRMETAGKVNDSMAGTSVDEPLVADQILSKALSINSPGPPSHDSLLGTSGKVLKWLGKNVGKLIQDNLKQKEQDLEVNVVTTPPSKLIIKHPVTKEIIHLPPRSTLSGPSAPQVPAVLNKNAKKKAKKKKKKLAQQQASTSTPKAGMDSNNLVSPLPICVPSQQDWEGLDSNGSKDTPFWTNFHAAQEDFNLLERPEEYPYMFTLNSEDERLSSKNPSSLDSQTSKDIGTSELDIQQLQMAYQSAADFIEEAALQRTSTSSVKSISSDASTKVDDQGTPSSHILPATTKEVDQITPSNANINKGVSSPPSTQSSWAQEVEAADERTGGDLLPLLEAYHKGYFDVQEVKAADALTVGELYETIPCDKELVNLSGLGVVSYPCPWIDSEDRDLLPEEHDLIHKLVTQYPFKFSMAGVPVERWYQVDTAKASKKFHKEQFEPP